MSKWREIDLKRRYNMTIAEYDSLLIKQDNKCAICSIDQCTTGKRFAVDHCHESNKVRGLLCKSCNVGLGELKDSKQLLLSAIKYLEDNNE